VGHSKAGVGLEMTMSRYSGDKSLQAKAAVVEAVKLPQGVSTSPDAARAQGGRIG
jgi:hypothetical protein